MDSQVALKYIPLLAGIPRSSAAQMTKLDIFKAGMIVMRFFTGLETEETSGSDSTMSRGSEIKPLELRRTAISHFADLEAEAVRINEEMKHG